MASGTLETLSLQLSGVLRLLNRLFYPNSISTPSWAGGIHVKLEDTSFHVLCFCKRVHHPDMNKKSKNQVFWAQELPFQFFYNCLALKYL